MSSPRPNTNAPFVSGQKCKPKARGSAPITVEQILQNAAAQDVKEATALSVAKAMAIANRNVEKSASSAVPSSSVPSSVAKPLAVAPVVAKPATSSAVAKPETSSAVPSSSASKPTTSSSASKPATSSSAVSEVVAPLSTINMEPTVLNDADVEELEDNDIGFWEIINNYEQLNTESGRKIGPLEIIKNTVQQQIFVNSNMLKELGSMFNCEIIFRRNDIGGYYFFIIPNNENYMIHMHNGINPVTNEDKIFFNLNIKQEKSDKKLKTEYISEYLVDDATKSIYHRFKMDGTPSILKKNRVNLRIREKIFNPYLRLNELVQKYFGYGERITMESPLAVLQEKIGKLRPKHLGPVDAEALEKISTVFLNEDTKKNIDTALNRDYLFLTKFTPSEIRNKRVEDIDYRIPNKLLYKTNNKFTDILAFRYSKYIEDFQFTKSCNGEYTYSDPLEFKLTTPFTATDIYLHKFDRHFNEEYAMDRYDLNSSEKLHRLAEIVELAKSLMMTFISISYEIHSKEFLLNERVPRIVEIHNIFPTLIWNRMLRPVWNKRFEIYKLASGGRFRIDIKLLNETLPLPIKPISLFTALEIPFVGIFKSVERNEGCSKPYTRQSIVRKDEIIPLDEIDLQGIERYIIKEQTISSDVLDKMYHEFFGSIRETAEEINNIPAKLVELTPEDFPALGEIISKKGKSNAVVSIIRNKPIVQPIQTAQTAQPIQIAQTAQPIRPTTYATSAATVQPIRKQLPLEYDISKIILDIRKFKKENLTRRLDESRRVYSERVKQITPLIDKLEELRRTQLEELRKMNEAVPSAVGKQTEALHKEGIIKLSRNQQKYQNIVDAVEKKNNELTLEAQSIRAFEHIAKSDIQKEIAKLMTKILNEKRVLYVTIPNAILKKGADTRILNDTLLKEFKDNQKPIQENILLLEAELKKLQQVDIEQQQRIERTRIRAEETSIMREETDAEKREKKRQQDIAKDQRLLQEKRDEYERFIERNKILKRIINEGLIVSKPNSPLHKYYSHALKVINKALGSFGEHVTAIEYLADARSKPEDKKPTEEDMNMFVENYKETLEEITKQIQLFNEVEINLNKTQDELEIIAIKLYGEEKPVGDKDSDLVDSAKLARATERRLQKEAEERRQSLQKMRELETMKAEVQASLQGLSEEELQQMLQKEKQSEEEYNTWNKLKIIYLEKIVLLRNEIQRISKLLTENKERLSNKMLSPQNKKALIRDGEYLEQTLKLLNVTLELKMLQYDNFLLENETIIKTNSNINMETKAELLGQIDTFKTSGLLGKYEEKYEPFKVYLVENDDFIKNNIHIKDVTKKYLLKKIEKLKLKLAETELATVHTVAVISAQSQKDKEERIKYSKWEKEYIKLSEEISKIQTDLKGSNPAVEGGLMRRLKDINIQLTNPNLSEQKKKKYNEEQADLQNRIRIISTALDRKLDVFNKFLLDNQELIRNNTFFKDKRLKAELIDKINKML